MGGNISCPRQTTGQTDGQRAPTKCERKQTRQQRPPTADVMETPVGFESDPDADSARQHPSRITHGFWLKQYSGLHEPQGPPANLATTNRNHGANSSRGTRRNRLLSRWTQLMMRRGSSSGELDSAGLACRGLQPTSEHGGAFSAPPTTSEAVLTRGRQHKRPRTTNGKQQRQQQLQHQPQGFACPMCLARTISSSTPSSASPSPSASIDSLKAKQIPSASSRRTSSAAHKQAAAAGPEINRQDQTRSQPRRLADWLLRPTSTPPTGVEPTLVEPRTSPRRLSPCKQIVRFLGARQESRAGPEQQVGASAANIEHCGAPHSASDCAGNVTDSKAVKSGASNLLASLFSSPTKRLNRLKASTGGCGGAVDEKQAARASSSLGDEMQKEPPAEPLHRRKRKTSCATGASSKSSSSDKPVIGGADKGGVGDNAHAGAPDKSPQAGDETSAIRASKQRALDRVAPSLSRSSSLSSASSCRQAAKRHRDDVDLEVAPSPRRESNVADEHFEVFDAIKGRSDASLNRATSSFKQHNKTSDDDAKHKWDERATVMEAQKRKSEGRAKGAGHWASNRSIKFAPSEQDLSSSQQVVTIREYDQQQPLGASSDATDEQSQFAHKRSLVATASSSSASFLPLIRPLGSSSSSFNSSSIGCLGGASSPNDLSAALGSQQTSSQQDLAPAGRATDFHAPQISIVASERMLNEPSIERPVSQPAASSKDEQTLTSTTVVATAASASKHSKQAATSFKNNFKKFVKRQQSVDSYRMARDLKQKLKRQQEGERNKHQSNEAIKATRSVGDEPPGGRKFSMRILMGTDSLAAGAPRSSVKGLARVKLAQAAGEPTPALGEKEVTGQMPVEICVDPYARPGSFMLPGEEGAVTTKEPEELPAAAAVRAQKTKTGPTPPNTLSLGPVTSSNLAGSSSSLLMGSAFSGCITPTYPTHHLPSPKYVSPATLMAMQKKYSNASTISSSFGGELGAGNSSGNYQMLANEQRHSNGTVGGGANVSSGNESVAPCAAHPLTGAPITGQQSDTESSFSITPSGRTSRSEEGAQMRQQQQQQQLHDSTVQAPAGGQINGGVSIATADNTNTITAEALAREEAAAALRRAQMAEHIYDNKCGLGEDMKFLASLPELCDITFLVGETREPVCAVKSVLAARSRVFHKILFGNRVRTMNNQCSTIHSNPSQTVGSGAGDALPDANQPDRRGSSPRSAHMSAAGRTLASIAKSSLPSSRSTSPNQQQQQHYQQQQQQQWSVTSDASGYNASRPAAPARADSLVAGSRSGRTSVASNNRESISQASQSSQQPLIIGPGQTATPAPKQRHKKHRLGRLTSGESGGAGDSSTSGGHSKNNRLSRMFSNKRASDPSIKHNQLVTGGGANNLPSGGLNVAPGVGVGQDLSLASNGTSANQSYLDKMSSSQKSTTMIIEEFEPDVFRQLIEYIHTGCVLLQARTLLGLLNAADYYGLEQLRKACLRFVSCCITVDTVCSLLSTAERYIQYKCTKSIVQKVLEFVDTHANEIFKLNAFGLLPEHVVRLILARDGLQADEHHKYNGVYTWCEHYCRSYELTNIADIMHNFLDLIQFHKIPTNVLLTEIYPTHVVPDEIFLSALAYQADVIGVEEQLSRPRRMTLPNTIMFKDYDDDDDDDDDNDDLDRDNGDDQENNADHKDQDTENRTPEERKSDEKRVNYQRRQSNTGSSRRESSATSSSQQRLVVTGRKSAAAGSLGTPSTPLKNVPSPVQQDSPTKSKAHRKGSIAQVSINGVKRLSHKLSFRKRGHSNMTTAPTSTSHSGSAAKARRRGSSGASSATGGRHQHASKSTISKQSSLAYSVASGSTMSGDHSHSQRDPIQVGRQILDAYLMAQRQRELEEEEQKRRDEAEKRELEEAKRRAAGLDSSCTGEGQQTKLSPGQQQRALAKRPLVKTPSSTRKSFRDFKHISKRLFMRHSSSKTMLQSQQSSTSMTSSNISFDKTTTSAGEPSSMSRTLSQLEKVPSANTDQQQQSEKSRRLLKIKRSETVFEATPSSGARSRKH